MFTRYAIYYTPAGPLAEAGASWLGWDVSKGRAVAHPGANGLDVAALTQRPRKYGFHATLKPPMVLASGTTAAELLAQVEAFCAETRAVTLDGLAITKLGGFFALTPVGDVAALAALAAKIVTAFDGFRAPPDAAELARRRGNGLSPAREANLLRWGYPHVMEEFRFHMTLTGRVKDATGVQEALESHFATALPAPFTLDHLTLAGERPDGMFEQIARFSLSR